MIRVQKSYTRLARSCQYAGNEYSTGYCGTGSQLLIWAWQWRGVGVGASEMHQYGIPHSRSCTQVLAGKDQSHDLSIHMPMAVSVCIRTLERVPEVEKITFPSQVARHKPWWCDGVRHQRDGSCGRQSWYKHGLESYSDVLSRHRDIPGIHNGMDMTVDRTKTISACQKIMKMCNLPVEPRETWPGRVQELCKHAEHMQKIR